MRTIHGFKNCAIQPQFAWVHAFLHREVLQAKRTAKKRGSLLTESDRMVQSDPDFETMNLSWLGATTNDITSYYHIEKSDSFIACVMLE